MAQYPKPSSTSGTFNNTSFNNNQTGGLTIAEGLKYFVSFPKTQSPSTITADNFTTTGNLDVAGDSQFGGNATFIGGATITGPLVFENDVEVGGDTTLDGTLLCLQTATIDGELTITNNVVLNPSALTPTVAPYLELTNGVISGGGTEEYCHLYLDPQSGYDMTLYTNQTVGGGLTVRGANGASFTLNPVTIKSGVVGAQTLNPIDMNGYDLYGFTYLYADVGAISFVDSSANPMLVLTNGGNTSYENLSMNNNNISNANTISSTFYNVGLYGTIAVNPSLNPTVLSISNSSTAPSASIYFQMFNSGGVASSPLNMTVGSVNCGTQLNLSGNNITSIGAISGNGANSITVNSPITMGVAKNINMNANPINSITQLSGTSTVNPITLLSPILMNTSCNLQMNNNNITNCSTITGNSSNNRITVNSDIYVNQANVLYVNNILPTTSPLTLASGTVLAYSPGLGSDNTSVATTAWVNETIIGNNVVFSSTTTNNDTIAPTTITFDQVYNETSQTNYYTGTPVLTSASATSSIAFTINFPTPAWPTGTTPKFLTGTLVNLSDTSGVSYCCTTNFFASGYNLGIQCNSQSNVLGSKTFTLTANINIGWT